MITEHIGQLLAQQGHGTLAVDLFIDSRPDTPDTCVALTTTGGQTPTWVHDSAAVSTELPTFQVLARSKSTTAARDKVHAIYAYLQTLGNSMINGVFFQRLVPLQTPFNMGRDGNNRWLWVVNFIAEKERG
jgi:hypothetical protein